MLGAPLAPALADQRGLNTPGVFGNAHGVPGSFRRERADGCAAAGARSCVRDRDGWPGARAQRAGRQGPSSVEEHCRRAGTGETAVVWNRALGNRPPQLGAGTAGCALKQPVPQRTARRAGGEARLRRAADAGSTAVILAVVVAAEVCASVYRRGRAGTCGATCVRASSVVVEVRFGRDEVEAERAWGHAA
jgi:hypothetical protein